MRTSIAATFAVAVSFASLMHSEASAGVIFDQSIDLTVDARASDSDFFGNEAADDFQLQSGANTITDVHWWGIYVGNQTPTALDDFTIRIFGDVGGAPGTNALHELAVGNVTRADTGTIAKNNFEVYSYSVDISPLTLTVNTVYWLSIVNNTSADTDDAWFWSFDSRGNGVERGLSDPNWGNTGDVLGFQLTNDAVAIPEPGSIALFVAGLLGLGLLSRRRRTAA